MDEELKKALEVICSYMMFHTYAEANYFLSKIFPKFIIESNNSDDTNFSSIIRIKNGIKIANINTRTTTLKIEIL